MSAPVQFKSIPWWLWFIPIVALIIATQRMPFGYYTFTRIVVCVFAGFFAFVAWGGGLTSRVWAAIFGITAILFNPLIPVHLSRTTWFELDLAIATVFAAHLFFERLGWLRTKQS
jgi:hypothetical protein